MKPSTLSRHASDGPRYGAFGGAFIPETLVPAVHELEEAGFLKKERVGRQNRYTITVGQSLRHPIESHCTVESLLHLISNSRTSN